jgi:uncharacterized protein YgbK (DUF1537 family)
MIAVIADDFTGAAELAGISLRYGLTLPVLLYHKEDAETWNNSLSGDGGIICTDSRSMQKAAAIYCTADVVETVIKFQPSLVYKKIDSVLRGYVIDEAKIQMRVSQKNKAFILPANPSLQRTISNGEYFINGKKITETGFINDPEFPIRSAGVTAMLHDETVQVAKHDDWLPVEGIVIGEAETTEDVAAWAAAIDDSWMLVGAGDFYTALLEQRYQLQVSKEVQLQSPHLYVCGTAFAERKEFIKKLDSVAYLPETVTEEWLHKAGEIIKQKGKAIIAIDNASGSPLELRTAMAKAVKEIVERENIKEIFIEGGSTAAAVLQELSITQLSPVNELQRGVVRMKANDLFITVKPGSYPLPNEIIKLYS